MGVRCAAEGVAGRSGNGGGWIARRRTRCLSAAYVPPRTTTLGLVNSRWSIHCSMPWDAERMLPRCLVLNVVCRRVARPA